MEDNKFYDYRKVTVQENWLSQFIDGYACFGWQEDTNIPREKRGDHITIAFKRDRNILNKTELTRLQQHYEACMNEIAVQEESPQSRATIVSLACGLIGCGFMAGSVFAVTAAPPIVWLSILLSVPGFAFWAASWIGYKLTKSRRSVQVAPLIEQKYDEACEVCDRACSLCRM